MKVIQPRRVHVGKTLWVLAVLLLFALVVARRGPVGSRHPAWSGRTMGTTYTIRLADAPMGRVALERLKAGAQAVLDEVNRQMSHYRTDSELSLFNRHAAGEPFAISEGFARVMFSECTGVLFFC